MIGLAPGTRAWVRAQVRSRPVGSEVGVAGAALDVLAALDGLDVLAVLDALEADWLEPDEPDELCAVDSLPACVPPPPPHATSSRATGAAINIFGDLICQH